MATRINSIRYPIAVDSALGRLQLETDYAEHVEQMIKQVLLTNPGERPHRPDFGCGLRRMIFAPNSDVNATLLQATIYQSLDRWLAGLIKVNEIEVDNNEEILEVRVIYTLRARAERRILNLEVTL